MGCRSSHGNMAPFLGILLNLLLLFEWLPSSVHANSAEAVTAAKCPPPEAIMPCRCRGWNNQIQVWCSHSDLERVNGALEHLMKLRTTPAIDELIIENNRMPALPARAFGALRIGRLLLRNNGLESISRNAFAGLEDFLEELYIVENKLVDFPYDSVENLKNLEAFTIERSKIRLLPKFSGLNRLKHIRIDGSLISSLPIGAFSKMGSIKQIHLVNSNLGRMAEGIFGPLDSLMLANFSGNAIEAVQRRSFALLPKLEVLSLSNNKLQDPVAVGRAVEVLASLKSLDLSNNQLRTLPEGSFVNLKTLQMLSLVSNQIQTVTPKSFTHLPALRKVDLSMNELRNFPKHFFEATPLLEELRVRRNLLSTPSEISELLNSLKSIRFLDLGENGITSIASGTFANHTQLQRLDLSDNLISSIGPNSFVNVPTLMEMSLRNNTLTSLPAAGVTARNGGASAGSWDIPSLIELDLSNNKLQALDPSTFDGFIQLTRIDLSFNNIKSLQSRSFSLNKNIEYLDLMGNGLSRMAHDALSGMKKLNRLDLSRNHLESLSDATFLNMRHLQFLNLGNNRLANLPPALFSQLVGLEELNLKSNLLNSALPNQIFNGLPNLKELNLRHNSLSELRNGLLSGLNKLEGIKLGSNQIIKLSDELFKDTSSLKAIEMNNNRIKELNMKSLANLPELEKFEARENRISTIDSSAFANSQNLQILDLAHNALTKLPDIVKKLGSLKVMDASHNQISQIAPDMFKNLKSLTELYLNDNRVQELLPHTFGNLESLTIVDLDGNELGEIKPDTFYNLPRLIYVRVSRNKLKHIQNKAFANLNSLDGLDLQENELETIGEFAFEDTGSLKYYNLSHNNFNAMNRMGLFGLKSLEVLDMSYNRVSEVDPKSLRHLKWLVELRISDNGICRLPVGVFDGMSRLKMLILKNNFLTHIYESVFYKLKNNIAFIDISGNPISCDCELVWLRDLMARDTLQELGDSTCENPNHLKGVSVKNVRPSRMVCSDDSNLLRSSRARAFGDEECPILEVSKRKPRPVLTQSRHHERPLFGNSPSASASNDKEFVKDSEEFVATSTNDINNRRKDEKLVESNDYLPGDTPTIYAGSTSNKKSSSSGSKSNSMSALSNLSSLLGITLPELDFGLNLGLSPSVTFNGKRKFDDDSNSVGPEPLPSSWLSRPSKIDENVESEEELDDDTIGNIYEPPEYIPRKPAQPYIPLNPFAESNNRAKVMTGNTQHQQKNNARGPLSNVGSFFSNLLGDRRHSQGHSQTQRPAKPASTGQSSSSSESTSWHPAYPNVETGFIPIEPFFHSKVNYKKGSGSISNETTNNVLLGTSASTPKPKVFLTSSSTYSLSSTTEPYVIRTKKPLEMVDDGHTYTPVDIKDTDKDATDGADDDLPDFWGLFATGTNNDNGNTATSNSGGAKKVETNRKIENLLPFNFSAPIDTVSYSESTSVTGTTGENFGSASNPVPHEGAGSHTHSGVEKTSGISTYTSRTNFSSSTAVINGVPVVRKQGGKSTVTKIGQGATKTGLMPSANDFASTTERLLNLNSIGSSTTTGRGLTPPVLIGDRSQEPHDWYYTNYNTNQQQAGEELEKYLERSRVNQAEDVLIDISQPARKSPRGASSSSTSSTSFSSYSFPTVTFVSLSSCVLSSVVHYFSIWIVR